MPNKTIVPMPGIPANSMRMKNRLKKLPGLAQLARLYRFVTDPGYRSEQRLLRDQPPRLFQPYAHTASDRYPRVFSFIRDCLDKADAPRLLSYGCSTGEEVFTLRQYFPHADITGIDINPRNIAVCRKKLKKERDNGMHFKWAASPKDEPPESHDAIFCMAVLRHGDLGAQRAEDCSHLIRFADFEAIITELHRCLKPGGYLAIRGSNFRLADTAIAQEFEVVFRVEEGYRADTPLYGPDNLRLAEIPYNDVVFRKRTKR
jgi:SAM-dependent methyltransferase